MTNLFERLMALLDGELTPDEAEATIREAAGAGNLRGLLEICYRTRRRNVAAPYSFIETAPVPADVSKWVVRAPVSVRSAEPPRRASYGRALLAGLKERYRVPGWSLAASHAMAMVLVAVASAWLLLPAAGQERTVASQDPPAMESLHTAFETTAAGKASAVAATVRPLRAFKSKSGEYCRQAEVRYGGSQVSHVLACRSDDGHWPVMAATPPGPLVHAPAGNGNANPRQLIDDRAYEMKEGDFFDREQERELLRNGWPPLRK